MANKIPVFKLYPGEFGLLSLMAVVSAYMWYGSYEYGGLVGVFPRFLSIVTLALSLILLVREILPERVRDVFEGESGPLLDTMSVEPSEEGPDEEVEPSEEGPDEEVLEEVEPSEEGPDEEVLEEVEQAGMSRKVAMVGFLTGAYMVFGYLFGLLWGTPLYIIAYLQYTNYSWFRTIAIAVAVTVVVYITMIVFNWELATGIMLRRFGIEVI